MKTEDQIKIKIAEHEAVINDTIAIDSSEWTDHCEERINTLIRGRKALLWVLSPDDFVMPDDFEKQALFECMCHESAKIF